MMPDSAQRSLPSEKKVWPSHDGNDYETYQKAVEADLAVLLGGDAREKGVAPAIAKIIVEHSDYVINILQSMVQHMPVKEVKTASQGHRP